MELRNIETRLARATTLPILPNVVTQVLALTDNMNTSTRDYERVISQDAALAAKILRTANSPYFGGNGEITNLRRALTQVGNNTLRSICLTVALQSTLGSRSLNKGFSPTEFWQHSLAVACGAKILACLAHDLRAEEAFIAGLVHDIGKLALCMFLPVEANHIYHLMRTQSMSQYEAEMSILELTHQDIGKLAAAKWGLPEIYMTAIAYHHTPAEMDGEIDKLTAYVHVSNAIAYEIGLGFAPAGLYNCADPTVLEMLHISEEQYEPIRMAIAKEVARMSSQMGL